MSLTTFLAKSDVREKFNNEFEKPKFQVKKEIVAPPLTKRYSLVGTAFDYLLRFHIEYWNPQSIKKGYWVAESALPLLSGEYREKGISIVKQAEANLSSFLETGKCDDELLKSTLLLAGLDSVFRTGAKRGLEYIGLVDNQDVQDLKNLISAVDMQIFKAQERCNLNPTFGRASILVGGADADLIIDDMLIDIKTTKNFELSRDHFHQLLGYLTLYYLEALIERKKSLPDINKLAIYFSRYSYLHVIEIGNITSYEKFAPFIKWFFDRAKADYDKQKSLVQSMKLKLARKAILNVIRNRFSV
jgi:hypothetical protein